MEKLFELLFEHGGLVALIVFVVPGFIAWRTSQLQRPQGEQKAADAIIDIISFSVLTSLLWYSRHWAAWPNTSADAFLFFLEIFITPIAIALACQYILECCAKHHWITSSHPRAWDFIFNSLALRKKGVGANGLFLIVTPKNGDKVAGLYSDPGYASLWPYDRDLLLGPTWELEDGKPAREVVGSIGLYVDAASIDSIEIFDYAVVLESVTQSAAVEEGSDG